MLVKKAADISRRLTTPFVSGGGGDSLKDLYVCKACWLIATPECTAKGSSLTEIVLWCLCIVPGVFYSVWRRGAREKACPVCSSHAVVPINSLKGRKFFREMYSNRNTRFVNKVLEYDHYDFIKAGTAPYGEQNQAMGS